jgi:hypothetical protein
VASLIILLREIAELPAQRLHATRS